MSKQIASSMPDHRDGKKVFKKLGTCSRTFFYILDTEFGHPNEDHEKSTDPLAGGILRLGHQCGMLWGAAMAIGAEAYRRFDNLDKAITVAVKATQSVMASFYAGEQTVNCWDITHCDFNNRWSFAKYMITRDYKYCFDMAERWAPDAIQTAIIGLKDNPQEVVPKCITCTTELARKMGANEEEMVIVAGLAGGLGLSGNACGALSAAIWLNTLVWVREFPKKSPYNNPRAEKTLETFREYMGDMILCHEITGRRFESLGDHSQFIAEGGCDPVIDVLVATGQKNEE